MNDQLPMAGSAATHGYRSHLSARMTFLGVISWLSVCLILVGLFPEISANLGGMWLMAGLFGLAAAVGLGEAAKSEIQAQNDLLINYLSEARTDALTGLGNRRAFDSDCEHWESEWCSGRRFALLLIDVDRFKNFNDRYGHQAGDEMLRAVARVLQLHTRECGTAIRYGGEEFAVMLPDTDLDQAYAWAEVVRERIAAQCVTFRNTVLSVTASIGIAVAQTDDTPDRLVVRADEQLYLAKAAGRNCCRPSRDSAGVHVDALLSDVQESPTFAALH